MSTLAKTFLKTPVEDMLSISSNKILLDLQRWTCDFVRSRLLAPLVGASGHTADQCAERFVFDEDAPNTVMQLVSSGAVEESLVWETLRMPATNFWIEFPVPEHNTSALERVGLMVGMVPRNDSVMSSYHLMLAIVCSTIEGRVRVAGLMSLPDIKLKPGESHVNLHWYLDHLAKQGRVSADTDADAKQFIYDLVYCLFLINTPRVCEQRVTTIGSPKKKHNRDAKALPLVELRRVVMKIGVGSPHYPTGPSVGNSYESADARHRRLHRVIGHFRTYREGREVPKVSFVPQHWRGDAELGILLHERVMKK